MKKQLRPAIAMIELIFALVIMGIVLMSAPQLISTAAKSGYVTVQQEAISEAASQVKMVMGFYWDETLTDETFLAPVLRVTAGNNDLNKSNTNAGLRKGTPLFSQRSFIRYDGEELNATLPASLGLDPDDNNISDDVDDFTDIDTHLTLVETSSADYVERTSVNIDTTVTYISDSPSGGNYAPNGSNTITFAPNFSSTPGGSSNIKRITVTLTSTSGVDELNKTIILNAFSCNIGATEFEERPF